MAGDGTVYVADSQNRRVQVFDAQGSYVSQFGRFGEEDGQFLEPIDVAVGPDGDVYVVDDLRDDIQRFSPAGQHRATIGRHGTGDGELNSTGGIFVGGDGTLYNADWTSERVQAWDDAGSFLWSFGTPGSGPLQFTDPCRRRRRRGPAASTSSTHGRVQAFSADRTYLGEAPVPDSHDARRRRRAPVCGRERQSASLRLAIAAP